VDLTFLHVDSLIPKLVRVTIFLVLEALTLPMPFLSTLLTFGFLLKFNNFGYIFFLMMKDFLVGAKALASSRENYLLLLIIDDHTLDVILVFISK